LNVSLKRFHKINRKFKKLEQIRNPPPEEEELKLKDNFKITQGLLKFQKEHDEKIVKEDKTRSFAKFYKGVSIWDEPDRTNPYMSGNHLEK